MSRFFPLFASPKAAVPELQGEPTPYLAYGFQRLVPGYNGPLCTLRESVGNTQVTFYPLAGGGFPLAQAMAFQGSGNVFVVTWNDQGAGGINMAQATAANQPQLDLAHAALNGKPAMLFGDATGFAIGSASSPGSIFGAGGFLSSVVDIPSLSPISGAATFLARTGFVITNGTGTNGYFHRTQVSATGNGVFRLTSSVAAGPHVIDLTYDSSSLSNVGVIGLDGANLAQTNTQPTGTITGESGAIIIGNGVLTAGTHGFPGYIAEAVFYQTAPTASQIAEIRARQKMNFATP